MSQTFQRLALFLAVAIVSFTLGRKFPSHPQAATVIDKTSKVPESKGSAFQRLRLARDNLINAHADSQSVVKEPLTKPSGKLPEWLREGIAKISAEDAEGYKPLFLQLGLSDEQAVEALQRIENAHVMANLAQTAISDLSSARKKHDDEMRKALSPEAYDAYVQYERVTKPSNREISLIENHLAHRLGYNDGELQTIAGAVEAHLAFSSTKTYGPYDPVPEPTAFLEEGLQYIDAERDRVQSAAAGMLAELEGKVANTTLAVLTEYYDQVVQRYQAMNDEAKRLAGLTLEERLQMARDRMKQVRVDAIPESP